MKVFKFTLGEYHYGYSGNTEEEARQTMFEDIGEMEIDSVEEIPESKWDEKFINIWEDNDFTTEPYKSSIRDQLFDDIPMMIFTNDMGSLD